MLNGRRRLVFAIAAGVVVAAIAVTLTLVLSGGSAGEHGRLAGDFKKAALSVKGHEGGEKGHEADHPGGRDKGEGLDKSPAAEAVASRAFPRTYVDDKRARSERREFARLPRHNPRYAFTNKHPFTAARTATPDRCDDL